MKGIVHFATGVAAASCFPEAVKAGAEGNPLYFILGGIFGLLPDTIDFKFYRFFYKHDVEITPDPSELNPQMIADAVAGAVNRAHETGKPVEFKLNTIRLGADEWRRYELTFDIPGKRIVVTYGPIVDTGQTPKPNSEPKTDAEKQASAPLACNVKPDYEATTAIDIFEGPTFRVVPTNDGRVTPLFIPWHREWTHSFVTSLLLALVGWLIWGWVAGGVIFAAVAAHILVDQIGYMGSSLLFPFQKKRTPGLKLMHSGEALPNFAAVWLSILIIFWWLYYWAPRQVVDISFVKLAAYGALLPLAAYLLVRRLVKRSA